MTSYITGFAEHYFKGGARVLFFSDWEYVSRKRLRTADVEYFHFYFSQICQRNCLSSLYSYFHFSENAKREKEKKNKFRIFLQNLEFFLCSKYFKFCLGLVHNWKQNRGGYCFLSCLKRFFSTTYGSCTLHPVWVALGFEPTTEELLAWIPSLKPSPLKRGED